MSEVKVNIKYPSGHAYEKQYKKTELFCCFCATKDVWENQDGGDYYVGADYLCNHCGACLYLDHCHDEHDFKDQIQNEIRALTK